MLVYQLARPSARLLLASRARVQARLSADSMIYEPDHATPAALLVRCGYTPYGTSRGLARTIGSARSKPPPEPRNSCIVAQARVIAGRQRI